MKTDEKKLNSLFDLMVEVMKGRLDADDCSAADIAQVRMFLKENGIEFIPEGDSEAERKQLADILPFRVEDQDEEDVA